MNRNWPLLIALIALGCTSASQDFSDASLASGDENTPTTTTVDPEPGSTEEPPSTVEPASTVEPESLPAADQGSDGVTPPVAHADLDQLFADFIESPERETWLELRQQVIASDAYQPYSDEFSTAEELLDLYELVDARAALEDTMPNLLLSPRAHRLLAEIESAGGDVPAAERERIIANACIEGILATGDGSEEHPWLVLRPSDEYDVLAHLGKRPDMQSLVRDDGKRYDLITCTDDSEVWFDVTEAFEQLGKSLGE